MNIKSKLKHSLEVLVSVLKEKNIVPIVIEKSQEELLKGKTALITGGSGGIGFAIAKKLHECGCKVILAGTNPQKLESSCEKLQGSKWIVINQEEIDTFTDKITEAVGFFQKIDILVCSAGTHTSRRGFSWENVTVEDYDSVMNVNLKGTYFLMQAIAKYMISQKIKGHILVVSSQKALEPSWSPYRLSKLGTDGIVKGFAQQLLQHGIIVNAIGPGPTPTAMQPTGVAGSIYTADNPAQRMTTPEEIAEFAKLLVSGAGDMVVGQTVYLSAGRGIIEVKKI